MSSEAIMSPLEVDEIVAAVSGHVRQLYVEKGPVAEQIAGTVEMHHAFGRYEGKTGPELRDALVRDLRSVNGDAQLDVRFDVSLNASVDWVDDDEGRLLGDRRPNSRLSWLELNGDGELVDAFGHLVVRSRRADPEQDARARIKGNGVARVEVLHGNVGLIELALFVHSDLASSFLAAAMTLMQHTNALIIDIRNTTGDESCSELLSYFISERLHFKTTFWRPQDILWKDYTTTTFPGPRYNPTPGARRRSVYILTSARTGHSAESFAFFMKEFGLGETVGETTAKSGHPTRVLRAGHNHFSATIPIGKSFSRKTGKTWERVGVNPDFPCHAVDARDYAHLMALNSVVAGLNKTKALEPSRVLLAEQGLLKDSETLVRKLEAKLAVSRRHRGEIQWEKRVTIAKTKVMKAGVDTFVKTVTSTSYSPVGH
ncbi:ClpP/crotonase-like domain-containing protein [Chytriomyces sp. MP71]|nr:ClpP/crotonase-like domain-containing protein [Chytriomyces sp. MP71]